MKKPKVFVTRKLPEAALKVLREKCEVEINPENRELSKKEIIDGVKGKDALLCLLTDEIDSEIMDASDLKVISNYAVGYDNVDIKAATKRKIPVTNTPGVLTETTADLAWSLLMATARRIVEADKFLRSRKWEGWAPMLFLGSDIWGKTLGIIGLGNIGTAMAKRGKGFNMDVIYYDRTKKPRLENALGIEYKSFEDVLQKADFVTLHVPLTKKTHHLISKPELELMKSDAYLINTSRGPVVDENALADALENESIAGAGLDVYEKEPKVNERLLKLDNVVLLPHLGSASRETRTKMAKLAVENLLAILENRKPPHIVNPEVLE